LQWPRWKAGFQQKDGIILKSDNIQKHLAPPKAPLSEGGGGAVGDAGGWTRGGGAGNRTRREYNSTLNPAARNLRKNATKQEQHLWYDFLKNFTPRFTRQRIIGNFIVDFFCAKALLVVELDGAHHYTDEGMKYDRARTAYMNTYGIVVLRFENIEIDNKFAYVCGKIESTVRGREIIIASGSTNSQ
jgi:very-short-patch-repair endonuclease